MKQIQTVIAFIIFHLNWPFFLRSHDKTWFPFLPEWIFFNFPFSWYILLMFFQIWNKPFIFFVLCYNWLVLFLSILPTLNNLKPVRLSYSDEYDEWHRNGLSADFVGKLIKSLHDNLPQISELVLDLSWYIFYFQNILFC